MVRRVSLVFWILSRYAFVNLSFRSYLMSLVLDIGICWIARSCVRERVRIRSRLSLWWGQASWMIHSEDVAIDSIEGTSYTSRDHSRRIGSGDKCRRNWWFWCADCNILHLQPCSRVFAVQRAARLRKESFASANPLSLGVGGGLGARGGNMKTPLGWLTTKLTGVGAR